MSSVSLRLIAGRQDHLGPCIILQVNHPVDGGHSTAEYLFGVGENAPRAMLEHRARPRQFLRATFAPTLDSNDIGGLGGLILRLRDDGHGKVGSHKLAVANPCPRLAGGSKHHSSPGGAQSPRAMSDFTWKHDVRLSRSHVSDQMELQHKCWPCKTCCGGRTPR